MALSPVHYLSNMIDHQLCRANLTEEEKAKRYEYLRGINSDYLPILICYCTGSTTFKSYLYEVIANHVTNNLVEFCTF